MKKISLKLNNKLKNEVLAFINGIKNPKSRKRAYVVSLGINALEKFLKDNDIKVDTFNCCSNNPLLLGEFDVADIKANNIKVDVRVMVSDEYPQMWIPRNHLIYGFTPDIYIGIKLNTKLTNAEIVGFTESRVINNSSGNKNYIIVESSDLKPVSELTDILRILNGRTKHFLSKDHDIAKELFLSYIDNEISNVDKEYLVRHLANCDECRNDFNTLYNMNRVFTKVSQSKEIIEMFSETLIDQEYSTYDKDSLKEALIEGTVVAAAITEGAVVAADAAVHSIDNIMIDKLANEISQDIGLFGKIKNIFLKKDKANSIDISEKANDISDLTREINDFDDEKQAEIIDKINDIIDEKFEKEFNQDPLEDYNYEQKLQDNIQEDQIEQEYDIENKYNEPVIEEVSIDKQNIQQEELVEELTEEITEELQQEELAEELTEKISEELQQEELAEELTEKISEELQQEELAEELTEKISEELQQEELAEELTEEITEELQQEELAEELTEEITEELQQEELAEELTEEITEELQQEELTEELYSSDIFNESPRLETEEFSSQDVTGELFLNDAQSLETLEGEIENDFKTKEEPITPETSYFSNFVKPESLDDKINYYGINKQLFEQEQITEVKNPSVEDIEISQENVEDIESSQENIEALLMGIDDVEIVGNLKNIDIGSGKNAVINFTIVKKEVNPLKIAATVIIATGISLAGYAYWKYNYILTHTVPNSNNFSNQMANTTAQLPTNNKVASTETSKPVSTQNPVNNQNQIQQPQQPKPYVKKEKVNSEHNNLNDDIARALITQGGPVKISNISWEISASLASNSVFKNYLMVTGQALKSALSTDLILATDRATNDTVKIQVTLDTQGNIQDSKIQISSGSKQVDNIVLQTLKNTLNYTKLPYIQTNKKLIKAGLIVNL